MIPRLNADRHQPGGPQVSAAPSNATRARYARTAAYLRALLGPSYAAIPARGATARFR